MSNYKRAIPHTWDVVKNVNNVLLLRCTCCERQRIGVAEQREKTRYYDDTKVTYNELTFLYHGYDYNYAEELFNKLVQKRNNENDEDYYDEDDNENNNNENNTTSNNNNVDNKRNNNNDNKTLVINNVKITITNPRFHVRGERR